jgi:hypothetical protein
VNTELILRVAGRLIALGIALDMGCSVGAAGLMRELLFGVRSWSVPTLAAVAGVLSIAALLANVIPARRAASVNPVDSLPRGIAAHRAFGVCRISSMSSDPRVCGRWSKPNMGRFVTAGHAAFTNHPSPDGFTAPSEPVLCGFWHGRDGCEGPNDIVGFGASAVVA